MFGRSLPPIVKNLLIVNLVMFALTSFMPNIERIFALGATSYQHDFQIYQFITYQYVHGGFWHIFGNMLLLFFLGPIVEHMWGSKNFFIVYTVAGVFAGLLHLVVSDYPVVGASGSIFAIFTAFAIYYPDQELHIWGVLPIKMKWIFMFHLVSTLIGINPTVASQSDNIAHWAHLGGMIVGFAYVRLYTKSGNHYSTGSSSQKRFSDSMSSMFSKVKDQFQQTSTSEKSSMKYKHGNQRYDVDKLRFYRKEVDELLDKINQVGYLQLTETERHRLEEASEYLKKFDRH